MVAQTRNVVLIVPDGVRWQEVFTGAAQELLNREHGGSWMSEPELRQRYWREDPAERRALLLPFLWNTIAAEGQIFGNQALGSRAHVTNAYRSSYPCYNEMLTGFADPRVDSNEHGPNPNTTVFEWLNGWQDLHGRVAVHATWGAFHDIFNAPRSGLPIQAGVKPPKKAGAGVRLTARDELLNELYLTTTHLAEDDPYNSLLHVAVRDYIRSEQPRALFVGYGETDYWAHQGRYDLLLRAIRQFDGFVAELWQTMQSMPQYRGNTTFIVTTDHGRGSGLVEWRHHGAEHEGSEDIWIAALGPDTAALGERCDVAPVTQSQIAATVAALLGRDFTAAAPAAAGPLRDVLEPANAAAAARAPVMRR